MTTEGHFRSAINGFHRGDVADFIETQSLLHKKETNRLSKELETANQLAASERATRVEAVKRCFFELEEKNDSLAQALALCDQLETQLDGDAAETLTALKNCLSK